MVKVPNKSYIEIITEKCQPKGTKPSTRYRTKSKKKHEWTTIKHDNRILCSEFIQKKVCIKWEETIDSKDVAYDIMD